MTKKMVTPVPKHAKRSKDIGAAAGAGAGSKKLDRSEMADDDDDAAQRPPRSPGVTICDLQSHLHRRHVCLFVGLDSREMVQQSVGVVAAWQYVVIFSLLDLIDLIDIVLISSNKVDMHREGRISNCFCDDRFRESVLFRETKHSDEYSEDDDDNDDMQ